MKTPLQILSGNEPMIERVKPNMGATPKVKVSKAIAMVSPQVHSSQIQTSHNLEESNVAATPKVKVSKAIALVLPQVHSSQVHSSQVHPSQVHSSQDYHDQGKENGNILEFNL